MSEASLKKRTARGIFWNAFGRYSNLVLQIAVSAILARLLSPKDFGIVAMVLVLSGFMSIFFDAALSPAIVQYDDLDNKDLSGICWFSISLGVGMFLFMAVCSPYIALFYNTPALQPVAVAMGLIFIFQSLGSVPLALLQRKMDFRSINLIRLICAFLAAACAVYLALTGAGYWALVVQNILYIAGCSLLFFYAAKWLPSFAFQLKSIKRIFKYSKDLTLFSAINYWARNADNLLIGKFWGTAMLGYYSHAYNLMSYPLSLITQVITPVLHPALASIQENKSHMRAAYLQVLKYISISSFPAMVVLSLLAPEIVRTLWGNQWTACVPVFQILSIVGLVQPIVSTSGCVFQACDRTGIHLKLGIINSVIICAGIAAGLTWGMTGVAIGYSIGYGIIILPTMYVVISVVLEGSLKELFAVIAKPALMTACVGLSLVMWNRFLRGILPGPLHLLGGTAVAAIVFLIALGVMDRPFLSEFYSLLPRANRSCTSVTPTVAAPTVTPRSE